MTFVQTAFPVSMVVLCLSIVVGSGVLILAPPAPSETQERLFFGAFLAGSFSFIAAIACVGYALLQAGVCR